MPPNDQQSGTIGGASLASDAEPSDPIFVTRPFLPPLEEFMPLLEEIWRSRILTNAGPFHQKFEAALAAFLGAPYVSLVANGTIALTVALETLGISGEVITTPYSFVATSHSLAMQGIEPVFVDIKPDDLNLDPERLEEAITPRTRAIMPVHCYGAPCDMKAIQAIADRHGLKVIYDAAHAFGVRQADRNILANGDFSTVSFHATKAFNTFEGGAIVANSADGKRAVDRLRNFGFRDEVTVDGLGFNAKMNEFSAALGLLQLKHFEEVRHARRAIDTFYRDALSDIEGLTCLPIPRDTLPNYSYFPILIGPEFPTSRDALYESLKQIGIFSRRYFYPLLSNFPMYADHGSARKANLPVANQMAQRVLCLPIYPDLPLAAQERIVEHIRKRA